MPSTRVFIFGCVQRHVLSLCDRRRYPQVICAVHVSEFLRYKSGDFHA